MYEVVRPKDGNMTVSWRVVTPLGYGVGHDYIPAGLLTGEK
jgi:hypothetical protein